MCYVKVTTFNCSLHAKPTRYIFSSKIHTYSRIQEQFQIYPFSALYKFVVCSFLRESKIPFKFPTRSYNYYLNIEIMWTMLKCLFGQFWVLLHSTQWSSISLRHALLCTCWWMVMYDSFYFILSFILFGPKWHLVRFLCACAKLNNFKALMLQ